METSPRDPVIPDRNELIRTHAIHEFDSDRAMANALGCYGELVRRFYMRILAGVRGRRILDCGCGFGLFSRLALDAGFSVVSIDVDDVSIDLARRISGVECLKRSVYATGLAAGSIDAAVCFDSIQHFDLDLFGAELLRLKVRQLIVYDSNTANPLLRAYRSTAGHEESHDRSADEIAAHFTGSGFRLTEKRYENFLSLPVSGGFQRPPVPLLSRAPALIYALDRGLQPVSRILHLDRLLAFRFCLSFEADLSR